MAVETAILSRVRLSTGMETSNPCGLLFSTGGESPNLPGLELSWLWGKRFLLGFLFICQIVNTKSQDLGLNPEPMETTHISIHLPDIHG